MMRFARGVLPILVVGVWALAVRADVLNDFLEIAVLDCRMSDAEGELSVPNDAPSTPDDSADPEAEKWEWTRTDQGIRLDGACIPTDRIEAVCVPGVIDGDAVVSIRSGAFADCRALTSVSLPKSVREVGDGAFFGCSSLTNVTLLNVQTIESRAFYDCTSLAEVEILYDANVAEDAFPENCKVTCRYPWKSAAEPTVSTNVIPNTVSNLAYKGYCCDDAITSLLVPDWVTNIEYAACSAMENLRTVVIGSGMETCDEFAFAYCWALTNVFIREGCKVIGTRMFSDCGALASIVIPSSVRKIESEAFYNCSALKSVVVPANVDIADDAFPSGCTIMRVGPKLKVASDDSYDDCLEERLIRLVDAAHWSAARKVNFRMETSDDEYEIVKRFSFTGITASRYEMQNDGTLNIYFEKPELKITQLKPTEGQLVVKVTPANGSSIVSPIDVYVAAFVTTGDSLADFVSGNISQYEGGYDLSVDTSDYVKDGILRIDISDVIRPSGSQFFRFAFTPQ